MSCPLSHTKCQMPGVKVRAIRRAFVDVAGNLHLVRIAAACSVSCLDSCSAPGRGWFSTHVRRLHVLYRTDFARVLYTHVRDDEMTLAAFQGALRRVWAQTNHTVGGSACRYIYICIYARV